MARSYSLDFIKGKVINTIKFTRDISSKFVDNYVFNELLANEMHNDPGASPSHFVRQGGRVRKIAYPKGEKKLIDEIDWYLLFKNTPVSRYLPKMYSYSKEKGNVFLELKFYTFPNFRKIIMEDMNAKFFLKLRWQHLFYIIDHYFYTSENSIETPDDFVMRSHLGKLDARIIEAANMEPTFLKILPVREITINGLKYFNLNVIIPKLTRNKAIMDKLKPPRLYYAHGDLHTNNILCGVLAHQIILLDCRGKSPYGGLYFDPSYDIAKIYHDLRSHYSLIEKHLYNLFLEIKDKSVIVDYEFNTPSYIDRFKMNLDTVTSLVKKLENKHPLLEYRAEFTEAMLYLTMIPFHLKKRSEGILCYMVGLQRLNEWLAKYHPEIYKELRGE